MGTPSAVGKTEAFVFAGFGVFLNPTMTDEQIDYLHQVLNSLLARDIETRCATEALRERVARLIANSEKREYEMVLEELRHEAAMHHERALLDLEKISPASAAQVDLRPRSPEADD